MLSLSLDCPFLIAHSVFFNVDLHLDKNKRIFLGRICKYDRIKEQVYIMRNYPILHFDIAPLQRFYAQIATIETLIGQEKQNRRIPVLTDKTCNVSWLRPIQPLRYDIYLEAKQSQQGPDQNFIECFKRLITDGKRKYLLN
jgi:hypothetical protein